MKLRTALTYFAACLVLNLSLYARAADDAALPVEQQLFNDFAGRMQEHLRRPAGLLNKIAQSKDPQERAQLMDEYRNSVRFGMKLNDLMQQVLGGPDMKAGGMMMKGKKMGGMRCSCPMMKSKGKGKAAGPSAAAGDDDPHAAHAGGGEAQDEDDGNAEEAPAGAGHENH